MPLKRQLYRSSRMRRCLVRFEHHHLLFSFICLSTIFVIVVAYRAAVFIFYWILKGQEKDRKENICTFDPAGADTCIGKWINTRLFVNKINKTYLQGNNMNFLFDDLILQINRRLRGAVVYIGWRRRHFNRYHLLWGCPIRTYESMRRSGIWGGLCTRFVRIWLDRRNAM